MVYELEYNQKVENRLETSLFTEIEDTTVTFQRSVRNNINICNNI
jgi:hypothetical protein